MLYSINWGFFKIYQSSKKIFFFWVLSLNMEQKANTSGSAAMLDGQLSGWIYSNNL